MSPEGHLNRLAVHNRGLAVKTWVLVNICPPVFTLRTTDQKTKTKRSFLEIQPLQPRHNEVLPLSILWAFLMFPEIGDEGGLYQSCQNVSGSALRYVSVQAQLRNGGFWESLPEIVLHQTKRAKASWNELEWFRNLESTFGPSCVPCLRKTMVLFRRHHYRSIGGWETCGERSGGATF